ncbi:MAG: hypothetical protein ACWGQW_01300 [bacterium]
MTGITTVIDQLHHAPLLADLQHIAETVGIPPERITSSLDGYVGPIELDWLRTIRKRMHTMENGFLYGTGSFHPSVLDRMMAIAGALTRNYIETRVMTLPEVFDTLKSNGRVSVRVLMLPDFHTTESEKLTAWQSTALYGLLLRRMQETCATYLQVGNPQSLEKAYGKAIAGILKAKYFPFSGSSFGS